MDSWIPLQGSLAIEAWIVLLNGVATLVVTVVGGLYLRRVRKKQKEREEREQTISELQSAVFGPDNVDHMEGMVEIMADNQEQSEENRKKIADIRRRVQELEGRVEMVEERLSTLKDRAKERSKRRESEQWSDVRQKADTDGGVDNDE